MNTTSATEHDDINRYESYLKVDPENTLLLINLGDAYHHAKRLDEAARCYQKCLDIEESNTIARGRLANILISQQRYARAESELKTLLEAEPNDAALRHNLGLTLYAQRKWVDALDCFKQAREKGLAHTNNISYMVYSLHQGDATGEALELAKEWLQQAPGPTTEGYIALLEMDHGDMQTAYEHAQRVLQQQPENPDAAAVVGNWSLEQQEIENAASHFEAILRKQPNNPRGWLGLGLVQLYQQKTEEAIRSFETVLESSPNHSGLLVTLGWAKLVNKDYKGAEVVFRKAIEAERNFGEAHGGLASALVFQNRRDEAEKAIKLGLGLAKYNFGALFAKSASLALSGKQQQGQKLLARVLEQPPVEGGKPLIENIQTFVQQQGLRGPADDKDKPFRQN